jgi:hypothetical protein
VLVSLSFLLSRKCLLTTFWGAMYFGEEMDKKGNIFYVARKEFDIL